MRSSIPIKVLIVDDSAIVRSILTRVLSREPDILIVGGAKDPFEAREMIIAFRPHVLILDIEMPRMDGLTFLRKLQDHYPVPVIMCSGVAPANSLAAIKAMEWGAIDIVAKPTSGGNDALHRLGEDLAEKIRAAAIAVTTLPPIPASVTATPTSFRTAGINAKRHLVAIGASTGGTNAIKQLLSQVPADFPPVVIVQHMPEAFTQQFAERLNSFSAVSVTEAVDGDLLIPGRAVLARGGIQMRLAYGNGRWRIAYGGDAVVHRHCPSVDVLFNSVAQHAGKGGIGILLTGMGADGASGLVSMRNAGAVTIAQNRESCVVYGMPKVAAELGAVQHTGTPSDIPNLVLSVLRERYRNPAQ